MLWRYESRVGTAGQDTLVAGLKAYRFGSGPRVLIVPGVHRGGRDEPRLWRLAEAIAADGFEVLTIEIPSFAAARLDPRAIEQTRAAVAELRPVGVVGISLGGGLAINAVEPSHGVGALLTIGTHASVADVAAASLSDSGDSYARDIFSTALGEPLSAASLSRHRARLEALDPVAKLGPPVWVLHGRADPLVPVDQSRRLCSRLGDRCRGPLVTSLLGHSQLRRATLADKLVLTRFVSDALRAFGTHLGRGSGSSVR